ncbi:carbohydrate sulfotransferase 10-like [Haliotis rufescens]|uniref:carbohydrate sulfotransferase 10-like n=1 Tax=Haliotis rufescens TaxID=6454 RepID=UPI00201E8602|nr:carbohydrate sulfotransferase 10-like [Haliotis rufescens]
MLVVCLALLELVMPVVTKSHWIAQYVGMPPPKMRPQDKSAKEQEATSPSYIEAEFQKRKQLYQSGCLKTPRGNVAPLLAHLPSRLAVCLTPKVGCTFWTRIMMFLNGNYTNQHVKSPFDIDRYSAHYDNKGVKFKYSFNEKNIIEMGSDLTKVLFVRDPYARLWSAYLDKIFLPDYWNWLRKRLSIECPKKITFEQFLQFVLLDNDAHWDPLSHLCDPCSFQPAYIGRLETFSRDAAYILNNTGLGHLVMDKSSYTSHVQDELSLLIHYNFKLYEKGKITTVCLSPTDLAERLWVVFQYNGYFSLSDTFSRNILKQKLHGQSVTASRDIVTEFFVSYFSSQPRSENLSRWHEQRNNALQDAYRNIPHALLHTIADKYVNDFILFDYEQYPSKYFKN